MIFMPREATAQDLIDHLRTRADVRVVLRSEDIQSPGDYIVLEDVLAQVNDELARDGEVSSRAARALRQRA